MSETKEFTKRLERKIIKIGVILKYGKSNAEIIAKELMWENTLQKTKSITNIINNTTLTSEQQIFVVQKLLAYPKATRISIANQILKNLKKDEDNNR